MSVTQMHREDVKAILRKRYGSIERFAATHKIQTQAVRDFLRGKSKTVLSTVAAEIGVKPDQLIITLGVPIPGTHSRRKARKHGQKSSAAA